MSEPLVTLISIMVIIFGITYLMVSSRGEAQKKRLEQDDTKFAPVQCPKCLRWKALEPVEIQPVQPHRIREATSVYYHDPAQFVKHSYKCVFCGHRWREQFESWGW